MDTEEQVVLSVDQALYPDTFEEFDGQARMVAPGLMHLWEPYMGTDEALFADLGGVRDGHRELQYMNQVRKA